MMEFTTSKKYYPGAISDAAATLMHTIYDAAIWFPVWADMSPAQIAAFAELQKVGYVESTAFYGYRIKGRDNMLVIRQFQAARNAASMIRDSLVSVGVEVSNIKGIYKSPNGFSPNPRRWCITLYKSAKVSATQINERPGLSGAIINGNQIFVLLGELERVG